MMNFSLNFEGGEADDHEIDFYDVGQALVGFQRSLAITTNLILNGTVITQAPSLKNARIIAFPPERGSWKFMAKIALAGTAAYNISTAPKDTPLGHLVYSAYDYVISETMGFHVDYDKSLGQKYELLKNETGNKIPVLEQSQFDSIIEKCENSIREMHRPIVKSKTAGTAKLFYSDGEKEIPFDHPLTDQSYDYILHTDQSKKTEIISGKVSSYNINTFKGRIYVPDERRPISFELSNPAQIPTSIRRIMDNMTMNAEDRFSGGGSREVAFTVLKNISRSGKLKSYYVLAVD